MSQSLQEHILMLMQLTGRIKQLAAERVIMPAVNRQKEANGNEIQRKPQPGSPQQQFVATKQGKGVKTKK